MHLLALLPGFISVYLLGRWGLERTFLYFFIPVLLIFPEYYKAVLPAFPDLSFYQGMALPMIVAVWLKYGITWRPRLMDFLVVTLTGLCIASDIKATSYSEAQNYIMDLITYVVGPYFIGRLLVVQANLTKPLVKQIVACACVVIVLGITYEWRFAINPFQILLHKFFPGQGDGWVVTFRFGMARAAGPYAHAILAGIMFGTFYRFQRWLMWEKAWPEKHPKYPGHPLKLETILFLICCFGVFANGAKGPWMGAFVAAVIVNASRVQNRKLYVKALLGAVLVIGIPSVIELWNYASVGREFAKSVNQETAAYRKELIEHYLQFAIDKAVFGWGKNNVPKVPGSESVDNYFLLLALMHGIFASFSLILMFLMSFIRLWKQANKASDASPGSNPIEWTLLGIFILYFVSLATVFMAYQIMIVLYFLFGWAETVLERGVVRSQSESDHPVSPEQIPAPRFRSILA